MKLTPDETEQLLLAAFGNTAEHGPIAEIVGDACELLTAKITIRLLAKAKKLEAELEKVDPSAMTLGSAVAESLRLASEIRALKMFAVELSEME